MLVTLVTFQSLISPSKLVFENMYDIFVTEETSQLLISVLVPVSKEYPTLLLSNRNDMSCISLVQVLSTECQSDD